MIVRSLPAGRSFKWLAEYLVHDPKADTAARVAWTQTLNLAQDDVEGAVDSMLHTYLDRDLLKAEAGVRPGGASLEKPVKHVSLSWHVSEKPSRADMMAATESFLKVMGWQDHQCLVVAHNDKPHAHVHLMLNMVHPERGTRLNDSYEWRRSQAWALGYEQARGKVFCEERLKPVAEREPSPPRNVWEQLRALQEYRSELSQPGVTIEAIDYATPPREWQKQEWRVLKAGQKAERIAFFENGRAVYRALRQDTYRQVREAYRKEWADYYTFMKVGVSKSDLAALHANIVARQAATLQDKCRVAAVGLRATRDTTYKALLEHQQLHRAELAEAQQHGRISPHLIQPMLHPRGIGTDKATSPHAPVAAPSPGPKPQPFPSDIGFQWTARGGIRAQQRSAQRWLDRAIDRLSQTSQKPEPTVRTPLAAAAERMSRKDERQDIKADKSIRPVGVEPDL